VPVRPAGGNPLAFGDICRLIPKRTTGLDIIDNEIKPECVISPRLIDFFWDAKKAKYDLTDYPDERSIVERVQTGLTEKQIFKSLDEFIVLKDFAASTYPEKVSQNLVTGQNDIVGAQTIKYEYTVDFERNLFLH